MLYNRSLSGNNLMYQVAWEANFYGLHLWNWNIINLFYKTFIHRSVYAQIGLPIVFLSWTTVIKHHRLGDPSNTFKHFYWSIDDSQCCVRFRCTAKWSSYTCTHIYPLFFRFFPHVGHYRVMFPVLYNRYSSVTYFIYSSVYMSIPASQFVLPTLIHWQS